MQDSLSITSSKSKPSSGLVEANDVFISIFGQKILTEHRCLLKWKEFFCIALYTQLTFGNVMFFLDLVLTWGAAMVLFGYMIIALFIGMPLFMLTLFLGNYTKKSYLQVWKLRPIVKGFGYTILIYIYSREMLSLSTGGLALMSIFQRHPPWAHPNCSLLNITDACYPIYIGRTSINDYYLTVDENVTTLFEAKQNVLQTGVQWSRFKDINKSWVFYVFILWFCIYLLIVIGFERFSTYATKLTKVMVIAVYMPFIFLIMNSASKYSVPKNIATKWFKIYSVEFWVSLSLHALTSEVPGNTLLLGSYIAADVDSCENAIITYSTKLFLLTIIVSSTSLLITKVKEFMNIANYESIAIHSYDIFFVLVPLYSYLGSYSTIVPVILWFLMIIIWTTIATAITIIGVVDTIIETFPILIRYRLCVCTFTSIFGLIINCLFLHRHFLPSLMDWYRNGHILLIAIILFIYLTVIFSYTMNNIARGYATIYRNPMGEFWKNSIVFAQLFCLCLVLYKVYEICINVIRNTYTSSAIVDLIIVGLILLPIFFAMGCLQIQYVLTKDNTLMESKSLNRLRKSKLEITHHDEHKLKTKCMHNCLLHNEKLDTMILEAMEKKMDVLHFIELEMSA